MTAVKPEARVAIANLLWRAMPGRSAPPPASTEAPSSSRRTGTRRIDEERAPDSRLSGRKHADDGDAKAALGDWYGAATAYVRAAADLPDDWKVRQKAALALVKSFGDLHQAADLAKQAVDLQTGRVDPRLVLAHVYLAAELPNAARSVLDGAEVIAPGDPRIAKLRSRLRGR